MTISEEAARGVVVGELKELDSGVDVLVTEKSPVEEEAVDA